MGISIRGKKSVNAVFLVIILVVFVIALFCVDYGFSRFNSIRVLEGWENVESGDGRLVLERKMNPDTVGQTIMFYTSDSNVDVSIDGEKLYTYGSKVPICRSPGSMWQFVELPPDADNYGKTLRIEITGVYPDKFSADIPVYCGSSGALVLSNIKDELIQILVNGMLLIYGVVMLIIYRLEKSSQVADRSDYLLGFLCIVTAFWSSCDLFTFQLVLPSGAGQYYLYYLCFFLLPLLTVWYLESLSKVMVGWPVWAYEAFIVVMIVLQLTGAAEFTQMLMFFLLAAVLFMGWTVIYIARKSKVKQPLINSFAMGVFFAGVIINVVMYFMNPKVHSSLLVAKTGLIIYVTVNTYLSFEHLIVSMVKISESEKMRDIAYMDQLTQIGNRYAFTRDIATIDHRYIGIVSLDLNNLKYYNDTFGHVKGDQMIKDAAKILGEVFEGSLYRTGGDEFISITAGKSEEMLSALREELHRKLDGYNRAPEHDIILEIACGYSIYREEDESYEDIQIRADEAMYADKAALKAASPIKAVR